jgi:hypothetical protein
MIPIFFNELNSGGSPRCKQAGHASRRPKKENNIYNFWSWVNVTENHCENQIYAIHLGSKHQLRHLQALFSSRRTRPNFSKQHNSNGNNF